MDTCGAGHQRWGDGWGGTESTPVVLALSHEREDPVSAVIQAGLPLTPNDRRRLLAPILGSDEDSLAGPTAACRQTEGYPASHRGGIGLRRGVMTRPVAPGRYPDTGEEGGAERAMSFRVLVDDNYHYMDGTQRWTLGEYATCAEALAACKRLVDACLEEGYAPGTTAEALYGYYTMFGDDPFIVDTSDSPDTSPGFSAWTYAKERCKKLCPDRLAAPPPD